MVEFALNNAVHASTGYTPFYVNGLTHPRVPLTLPLCGSGLGGGEMSDRLTDDSPSTVNKQTREFLATRFHFLLHVRDTMDKSKHKQKQHADYKERKCMDTYTSKIKSYLLLKTYLQK